MYVMIHGSPLRFTEPPRKYRGHIGAHDTLFLRYISPRYIFHIDTDTQPYKTLFWTSGRILWRRNLAAKRNLCSSPLLPLVKGGRGLARHTRNFLRDQPNHGDTACSAQRKQIATKPARLDAPYLWESWDIFFVVIGFVCLER